MSRGLEGRDVMVDGCEGVHGLDRLRLDIEINFDWNGSKVSIT